MTSPRSASDLQRELLDALRPHHEAREAKAIARLYLEDSLGLTTTHLLLNKTLALTPTQQARWESDVARLASGHPLQYVLGFAHFMERRWEVNASVLIPRPETEGLVRWAVERCPHSTARLLDAGTGSGCIAVSLALRLPTAKVTAWDLSVDALTVARHNADAHHCQVHFEQRDLLAQALQPTDPLGCYDLLVSNPPYIPASEATEMDAHVVRHEPHMALFVPSDDPLRFYRALALLGQHLLSPQGSLLVECHRDFVPQVAHLFALEGYQQIETRLDCFDQPRFVAATKA